MTSYRYGANPSLARLAPSHSPRLAYLLTPTRTLFADQVFVETLDKSFENVCELDIIFNQQKAGLILDEMITGGLVLETSSQAIVAK